MAVQHLFIANLRRVASNHDSLGRLAKSVQHQSIFAIQVLAATRYLNQLHEPWFDMMRRYLQNIKSAGLKMNKFFFHDFLVKNFAFTAMILYDTVSQAFNFTSKVCCFCKVSGALRVQTEGQWSLSPALGSGSEISTAPHSRTYGSCFCQCWRHEHIVHVQASLGRKALQQRHSSCIST